MLGNEDCTDVVNINVKIMMQVLFLRHDLILHEPENERSASTKLIGSADPIISKTCTTEPGMIEGVQTPGSATGFHVV